MQLDESDIWTGSFNHTDKIDISIRDQFLREGYSVIVMPMTFSLFNLLPPIKMNTPKNWLEPTEKINLVGHNRAFSLNVKRPLTTPKFMQSKCLSAH